MKEFKAQASCQFGRYNAGLESTDIEGSAGQMKASLVNISQLIKY